MPSRERLAPAALLALAAAVVLAGCGHSANTDRDAVRAYIQHVNAIQAGGADDVQAANTAYAQFSQGKLAGAAAVRTLTIADDELRAIRGRLAKVPSPASARVLRARLLVLFDGDIGLADEAAKLAVYVPAASAALAPLPRAGKRLSTGLAAAKTALQQTGALDEYGRVLSRLETRLRRLQPPPVLLDSYRAQLLRLDTARGLTTRLRGAIRARDAALVARLLKRFQAVNTSSSGDLAVQRAAVKSYRRRVLALTTAAAAVRNETGRLNATLR